MGYLNNQLGYREDILENRSVVKKKNYAVLDVDGLVANVIPGYHDCKSTILGSPAIGASFADYLVTVAAGGKNDGIGGNGIESFLYVLQGEVHVNNADGSGILTMGGYFYSPANLQMSFANNSDKEVNLFVYRRRYSALPGKETHTVISNIDDLEWIDYEGMANCQIKNLLPSGENLAFDMNMHILKFAPGASHGYIETHIQQHGAYVLTGKGMYNLDNDWMPIKQGDYIFMDAYCPQACYGVGDEPLAYLYSKDCNRDVEL